MGAMTISTDTALIVIDVQDGFDDAFWGASANLDAERNIAALLAKWSEQERGPIVIVRHDSVNQVSPLHRQRAGNNLKGFVAAASSDLVISKTVNSAFYGDPDLHGWLREHGITELVLCGIQTNMCVETTARMAGNLGYQVQLPLDATRTFDLAGTVAGFGELSVTATQLMQATALNLHLGGFATVTTTASVLQRA